MKTVWIGLVDVIPSQGSSPLSPGAKGAFVNALAWASNTCEYKISVESALSDLNLKATEFEDVERFRDRSDRGSLSKELYAHARQAAETGAVVFGSFHNYFVEG